MSLSKALAGLAALSAAVYAYARLRFALAKRRYPLLLALPHFPGTFPLGNALRMGKDGQIAFYRSLRDLVMHEESIRHLGAMQLFSDMVLVCYRPAHAHAVLKNSTYREGIKVIDIHLKKFLGQQSIVQLMHQPWKDVRTVLVKSFRNADLISMSLAMTQSAWRFVDQLLEVKSVDFLVACKGCTLDIIGRTAFGYDFGGIASIGSGGSGNPVGDAFQYLLEDVTDRQFRPALSKMLYWLPTERNREHAKAIGLLRGTLDHIVAERMSFPANGAKDLLGSMLLASQEGGALAALSRDALTDNLLTFMFGGFDTTSIALTYALFLLATHPEQLARLRCEVDAVLQPGCEFSSKNLKSLPYCTNVIKETLRLYPPAPLTARTMTSSVDLDGFEAEAGVKVMIPIWWVHRDEAVWPEPEKFNPDRFNRELPHGSWIPFSDGLRNCVGYRFAMMETTIVLAVITRALTWKVQEGYTLRPKNTGVVQQPADGLPLVFEART